MKGLTVVVKRVMAVDGDESRGGGFDGSPAERSRLVTCGVLGVTVEWSEAHGSRRKEGHGQEGEEIMAWEVISWVVAAVLPRCATHKSWGWSSSQPRYGSKPAREEGLAWVVAGARGRRWIGEDLPWVGPGAAGVGVQREMGGGAQLLPRLLCTARGVRVDVRPMGRGKRRCCTGRRTCTVALPATGLRVKCIHAPAGWWIRRACTWGGGGSGVRRQRMDGLMGCVVDENGHDELLGGWRCDVMRWAWPVGGVLQVQEDEK